MKRFRLGSYIRTHLKNEIFFLITFVCILQAAIIGFVTWRIYAQQLFDREEENLIQLLNVVNQDLDSRIEAVNSIALDIVISNEIKSSLNRENSLEVVRAKNIVNSILSKKFLSASNDLIDLSIIDLQNNTYSTRATYLLPHDFHLQDTDVFKIAETYRPPPSKLKLSLPVWPAAFVGSLPRSNEPFAPGNSWPLENDQRRSAAGVSKSSTRSAAPVTEPAARRTERQTQL